MRRNGMKKLILFILLYTILLSIGIVGCSVVTWEEFNPKNGEEYVVRSVEQRKGYYIYGLQRAGTTETLLPSRSYYEATEQYRVNDTIVVRIELKN